jgi:hypothetical protein
MAETRAAASRRTADPLYIPPCDSLDAGFHQHEEPRGSVITSHRPESSKVSPVLNVRPPA